MFVDLIEYLRCPAPHEESLLVAAATRSEERKLIAGVLGCPVCGVEYPIAGGVVRFAEPAGPARPAAEPPSVATAMRIAAFLELTDARGFAILCGRWAAHAATLGDLAGTPLLLVNPPEGADISGAAAVLEVARTLPVAAGSARAATIDPAIALPPEQVVRALRGHGRALGPASLPLPTGMTELARDAREWVAEKNAAPEPAPRMVKLQRR